MADHFIIIGNGTAGFRAAKDLRCASSAARVSLFTQERYPFYLRRQLGDLLSGEVAVNDLVFQSRNAYRRERLDLFLSTRVERIEPQAHEIVLASGERARYDRLLAATGTEAVPTGLPGETLTGVVRFDTLARAAEARAALDSGSVRRAVILDEGLVGLAMAEGLAAAGVRVTQLVRGERYWPEMLDDHSAALIEALLEERNITIRRGAVARAVVGAGQQAIGVETADGEVLPAELIGWGSRRRAATALLEKAGAAMGCGVRVDGRFQTSIKDVFAAGDVAEPSRPLGTELAAPGLGAAANAFAPQPEWGCPFCWQRAWAQGDLAAAGMMDRQADLAPDAIRLRGTVFGRELAVIGDGHLAEGGEVAALDVRDQPDVYRRLVFRAGRLVGAIVLGSGEPVQPLNRMVTARLPRRAIEAALGRPPSERTAELLPMTFAQHCPICAAELVVYQGTRIGELTHCRTCNTDLVVRWNGQRGWLEVIPP